MSWEGEVATSAVHPALLNRPYPGVLGDTVRVAMAAGADNRHRRQWERDVSSGGSVRSEGQ